MTEAEWLVSEDPAAMLARVIENISQPCHVSDRKLRLFVHACAFLTASDKDAAFRDRYDKWLEEGLKNPNLKDTGEKQVRLWAGGALNAQIEAWASQRANLLREIVGNPFQPWIVGKGKKCDPYYGSCSLDSGHDGQHNAHFSRLESHWLTPLVVSLAQGCYDERERECGRCQGYGETWGDPFAGERKTLIKCPDCHGTGRINDGTLDPQRLLILSDALEDAGCDNKEILLHLRGLEPRDDLPSLYGERYWKPLRGPHVRGCWALDLLLGKE